MCSTSVICVMYELCVHVCARAYTHVRACFNAGHRKVFQVPDCMSLKSKNVLSRM